MNPSVFAKIEMFVIQGFYQLMITVVLFEKDLIQ